MLKFKVSFLCIFLAVVMVVGTVAVQRIKEDEDIFQGAMPHLTAQNLALNKMNGANEKNLTDGSMDTSFLSATQKKSEITIDLGQTQTFNCIVMKEEGLNIQSFSLLVSKDGETYQPIYEGDKVEYQRLCTFDAVSARYVRMFVNETDSFFRLKEIEIYNQPAVEREALRMTGYVLNSDFYEILRDEAIPQADKHFAIQKMLESHNFAGLTHVFFYCGVGFDANGNAFMNGEDTAQREQARQETIYMINCMREFGNPSLKITYVVPVSTGNPAVNTAMDQNKAKFQKNLIALANDLGVDGIDFDYEFPQSDYDYQVFGRFLVELKKQMVLHMNSKENCILSCAFGTRDIDYPREVIEALDMVNMMTYDIFDQDGQHSSFWSCAVQGAKYMESVGFSKEQINVGIPFYGTQTEALMEQYIYKNAPSFDYYNNFYTFPSYFDGSPTEVYFNSPAMVRDKTAYALLAGYGGIMVWHFACDIDISSPYSLWRAAYTAARQFGGLA